MASMLVKSVVVDDVQFNAVAVGVELMLVKLKHFNPGTFNSIEVQLRLN